MTFHRSASDDLLVDRVRGGSAEAFEVLFDRHHRQLLAFCRYMLGSAADAEDAVQHTLMAAYADLMRSDKPIALRPWLFTIARHRCLSMLRARRERPVAALPEPEVHLGAELEAREELRATLTDIAGLPEDQRAALILAELGDVSHAHIAATLGCRPEKVKALVFQARARLAVGRTARETPCAEIREQLAVGGTGVRRVLLRQHVRHCVGCREFGEHVRLQRRRLAVLLPVAPGLGLKRSLLAAMWGWGGGGAAAGVTTAAGLGGLAATVIVSVNIAGGDGSSAEAASAGRERLRPAIMASAETRVSRRVATRAARPARPRVATSKRSADAPSSAPRRVPTTAPESPVAASRRRTVDVSPTGNEAPTSGPQPAVPPESPAKAPAEPPDAGKPAGPPTGGNPREPSGGKPAEPPGGRPATPPGGGSPPQPPAGRPAEPPEPPVDQQRGEPPPGRPADPPPAAGEPAPAPPRR